MDFDRKWTDFAIQAEVHEFGVARLVRAHNALRALKRTLSNAGINEQARAEAAEARLARATAVIAELVACKELKAQIGAFNTDAEDEYERRKPAAWEAARAFLAERKG